MPPALMAATPVGAVTTIRLELSTLIWCRNVVLPVPALPVRKIFLLVLRTYSNARSSCWLETKLMCEVAIYNLAVAAFRAGNDQHRHAHSRAVQLSIVPNLTSPAA